MFPDKPLDYLLTAFYVPFNFTLTHEFITAGEVQIKQVDTWFTDFNMLGARFTFSNSKTEFTTVIFGTDTSSNGKPVTS